MFKYMKYELKGTYKFILGVLALVFVLLTGMYAYSTRADSLFHSVDLFMPIGVILLFGAALTAFLYIVGSFRKELYEDSGYLTFTLPLTGNQILGSKLIAALFWFMVLGISVALYNFIMVLIFSPFDLNLSKLFSAISQGISIKASFYMILSMACSGVSVLLLIYFSMTLSKVTFRNKKIGGVWFVIFVILSGVLGYMDLEISRLIPYYLDLNTFHVQTPDLHNDLFQVQHQNNGLTLGISSGFAVTNIASFVYNFVLMIALFLGTGYLIEKKINL
ncbi:ABC-2 transporter permease [Heyndrickxia acidiproducens]|uniref:ABC-2 transporter permease n=1 Tax=Heyndrickxia acidiproducens TaxID=1121084 RepID=UPI000381D6BD|nr:ABC-2 transporter permease [Heyndrickxia acidiproducens]